MTHAGKSMFYFSGWVFACGLALMLVPQWSLSFIDMHLPDYSPVRLFGMVLVFLGIYYVVTAKNPACWPFYRVTVFTRGSALPLVIIFVLLGWARPIIVGFVVIDALGALWTWLALKRDKKEGLL